VAHTFTATVTSNGMVSIPAEARRRMGIKPNSQIIFSIDDDVMTVKPVELTLEDVIGSLPPLPEGTSDDLDELIHQAVEKAMIEKYGRQ